MYIPRLEVPTLAISGGVARFPVRRIYCVSLNYADHAREMGNDPQRHPPFFFCKPATVDGDTRQSGDLLDMIWTVDGQTVRGMISGVQPIEVKFDA